jgi:hypothetical protein
MADTTMNRTDLVPGVEVEVLTRFRGDWSPGFEIDSIDHDRCWVRRRSDRVLSPAAFPAVQLRRAR